MELQRLAFSTTLHQIAQRCELRFTQHTLEIQVQLNAVLSKDMRKQMLGI